MTEHGEARAPEPFTLTLKTADMEALWAKLLASGWADMAQQRLDINDVIGDFREFVHQSERGETFMRIDDLGSQLKVRVTTKLTDEWSDEQPEPTLIFEASHISPNRLFALLDVFGIVRADDGWMSWYLEEVWG